LNGNTITSQLSAPGSISPDSGISSFTLNPDGSIASESANTQSVLQSGVGDQGLSGNTVSLDQSAAAQAAPTSAVPPGEGGSIGETQAVSSQVGGANSGVTTGSGATVNVSPDTASVPANEAAPVQQATPETNVTSAVSNETTIQQTGLQTNGATPNLDGPQPTTPTISGNETPGPLPQDSEVAQLLNQPQPSQTWIDKFGSTITNDGISVINDVRGWFGYGPINIGGGGTIEGPVQTIGIRG
jgi:hypothetical protein